MNSKNRWKNYRNRWVYLKGKKMKLRKYIAISAGYMKSLNKPGWQGINHLQNYKNSLGLYGFKGLEIYEDFFYKGIPLPEKRSFWVRLGLRFAPLYAKIYDLKFKIFKK